MCFTGFAQQTIYPLTQTEKVVWGQGYQGNTLTRMPAIYQATIPSDVWDKTLYAAGMQIRFRTNSTSIKINYNAGSLYSYDYQSKVGSNGLDMYVRIDNEWHWVYPNAHNIIFGNASFTYSQIQPDDNSYITTGYEYCLYLPEICQVNDLSIEINNGTFLDFIPVPQDVKPIVIYGTSIINGQNASRPGNNITNIISRNKYDIPIINMGFRSVARMEPEVVAALNAIDAQIYILDCMPNMNSSALTAQIADRFVAGVDSLKKHHPKAAVVLVEHPGYSYQESYAPRKTETANSNAALLAAYELLTEEREYKHIYYISKNSLGIDVTSDFSDHIHPSDKGMYVYANTYTTTIDDILELMAADTVTAGITPELSENKIKVYPNPASEKLFIDGVDGKFNVEIFDTLGKSAGKYNSKKSLNISALPSGVYVVKIFSGNTLLHSEKIIKN